MWCFSFCEGLVASKMQLSLRLSCYYQALTASPRHPPPVPPPLHAHLPSFGLPLLFDLQCFPVCSQRGTEEQGKAVWVVAVARRRAGSRFLLPSFLLGLSLFSFCPLSAFTAGRISWLGMSQGVPSPLCPLSVPQTEGRWER